MDQTPEYCVFPTCPVLADLRQTVRTMHDDASALQVRVDDLKAAGRQARDEATAALDLVSRIRMALNDNGKRMQDELLAYCRELVEKEAGLVVAHARIKILEMQAQSQWTPTSESLPPEASKCLVFTEEGVLQAFYAHSGIFCSGGHRERPSHWMLQPEPPKP